MSEITIRPYEMKDSAYVERVCIETAGYRFTKTPVRERAAAASFCRFFITRCPEFCFVAVDADDIPVGYILCTPSFGKWCRYAPEHFLHGFPYAFFWSIGSILGAAAYIRKYPAHLHINILQPYQRMGLGRKLICALEDALRRQNCPGVSLCVNSRNNGAMRFYERCGYQMIGTLPGSVAYGKRLTEE